MSFAAIVAAAFTVAVAVAALYTHSNREDTPASLLGFPTPGESAAPEQGSPNDPVDRRPYLVRTQTTHDVSEGPGATDVGSLLDWAISLGALRPSTEDLERARLFTHDCIEGYRLRLSGRGADPHVPADAMADYERYAEELEDLYMIAVRRLVLDALRDGNAVAITKDRDVPKEVLERLGYNSNIAWG